MWGVEDDDIFPVNGRRNFDVIAGPSARPSVRPSDRPLVRPAHVKITRKENGFGPPFPIAALSAINRRFFGPREARHTRIRNDDLSSARINPDGTPAISLRVTHISAKIHHQQFQFVSVCEL